MNQLPDDCTAPSTPVPGMSFHTGKLPNGASAPVVRRALPVELGVEAKTAFFGAPGDHRSDPNRSTRRHGFALQVEPHAEGWQGTVVAGRWARPTMVLRTAADAHRWCRWMADRLAAGSPVGVAA